MLIITPCKLWTNPYRPGKRLRQCLSKNDQAFLVKNMMIMVASSRHPPSEVYEKTAPEAALTVHLINPDGRYAYFRLCCRNKNTSGYSSYKIKKLREREKKYGAAVYTLKYNSLINQGSLSEERQHACRCRNRT
jgi:hypothetical protein